ncbi:UBN2_2 domain-containing protein, partial [Cephalotus follicularis]
QKKWVEDDYIFRFTILNAMKNSLFNVFHIHFTALELWNKLQRRYVNEDAGKKSFPVNMYIDYKMDDSKSVTDQVYELCDIAIECAVTGESISETFQVSIIIGRFPSSWNDYQKVLKHKKKSLNMDQLLQHIQTESEAHKRDKIVNQEKDEKVHNVEGPASISSKPKNKFQKCKNDSSNKKKKRDNPNTREYNHKKKKDLAFYVEKWDIVQKYVVFVRGRKQQRQMW